MITIERSGHARCHREPRNGENGLEGYNFGEIYYVEFCKGDKTGRYVRVYHRGHEPGNTEWGGETYYETCGPEVFLRFFEEPP